MRGRRSTSSPNHRSVFTRPVVGEVLRWISRPIELDDLVSTVAALQNIKDLPTVVLPENVPADSANVQARLEGQEALHQLWRALRELSAEQRDVFCFGFEDEKGRDLFTVLFETEIVTLRELAQELNRSTDEIVRLWSKMPMDNNAIAEEMKITRGRVYQYRSRALEKLKGLLPFSGENKH